MDGLTFTCPVCGADVPRRAKSCPDCGACEKSGWSQDRHFDGLNLPGTDFNYGEFTAREFGSGPKKSKMQWFWLAVTILVILALGWMTLRGMG
jgi:hypothetical protein